MTGTTVSHARPRRRTFILSRPIYREAVELGLAALAFLLYFVVRANVMDRPDLAFENARALVDFERSLGIYVEADWQRWALGSEALVRFFNFVYFWLDFPLIAALGIVMYARRRRQYTFTRDAILFTGAVALVCYALIPLAPPRLLPDTGLADTLQQLNNLSYQAQSTSFFVNPYAALPSLHVGWAVLISLGVLLAWPRNRLIVCLALLHPFMQWTSTIVTGNHFFLDGVAGIGAATIGVALALLMQRRGYRVIRRVMRF
jgi:hypothetical protein